LYYGEKLDHLLINPNQIRHYGIPLWDNPYDVTHNLSIEINSSLQIPLSALGTKVGFHTRVPTPDELATSEPINMTSSHPWNDPSEVIMIQSMIQGGTITPWKRRRCAAVDTLPQQFEYFETDCDCDDALLDSIDPSLVNTGEQLRMRYIAQSDTTIHNQIDTPARRTFISNNRHAKLTADLIAERFGNSNVRAQRTLRVTTQRGVQSAILPISRRYWADRVLGGKRLNGKFATDTVYGKICSLRGISGHNCFIINAVSKPHTQYKRLTVITLVTL
jgi:hypothetical protein